MKPTISLSVRPRYEQHVTVYICSPHVLQATVLGPLCCGRAWGDRRGPVIITKRDEVGSDAGIIFADKTQNRNRNSGEDQRAKFRKCKTELRPRRNFQPPIVNAFVFEIHTLHFRESCPTAQNAAPHPPKWVSRGGGPAYWEVFAARERFDVDGRANK